jgi:hypothetical protein
LAPISPTPSSEKPRTTIVHACDAFVRSREAAGLSAATLRKYRTFTKQLTVFAEDQGYVMLDQFEPDDIDRFWVNWKLGPRAKGKRLTTLRRILPVLCAP